MKLYIPKNLKHTTFLLVVLVGSIAPTIFGLSSYVLISSTGSISYEPNGVIFEDRFESGDFNAWKGIVTKEGDDATIEQLNPYEGSYHACFHTNGTSSGKEWAASRYTLSPKKSAIYVRGYFYIASGLPLDDDDDRFGLITLYAETGELQAILRVIKVSGIDKFQLKIANGTSYLAITTDATYPQERDWFCIELYFKMHPTEGEGRVWINGVERITVTRRDTDNYGGVGQVRFGLASVNVQHSVDLFADAVVISNGYVGELYNFAVVTKANGGEKYKQVCNNIFWMLGNLSIRYKILSPSEVTDETVFDDVDGIISFVSTSSAISNASAVRAFAKTHVVITHGYDFANFYCPSFSSSYVRVRDVVAVTYLADWGAFRISDKPEMRRIDDTLGVFLANSMSTYVNITKIAQYSDTHIAFFHMSGEAVNSGYYVMDLYATRNSTLRANNWHLFPAMDIVRAIPVGKYARWLADELSLEKRWVGWHSLNWVNSFMRNLANNNPDLVRLSKFGTSVLGRNMYALFIGKGSRYILVDGAIHGDEKTGTAAALRTAELLVEYYNSGNSYWRSRLNEYKIIVVPVSNPDGYYAHKRTNANGKDLNRNYPPTGEEQLTEPESQAFANLLGKYTPTIFINLHTFLNQILFYQTYAHPLTQPFKTFALETWRLANTTYTSLKHWGKEEDWFSGGWPELLGRINSIGTTGAIVTGPVIEYAWWKHNTISALVEFYHACPAFNLLGQEFFCSVIFTAIQHYDRVLDIQVFSTGKILTTSVAANACTMYLHTQELQTESQSKIFVGDRGKPSTVVIDGVQRPQGDGWSWSDNGRIVGLIGVRNSVSLDWTS